MRKQRAKHHTRAPFLCQKKFCISKAKKGTAILLSLVLVGTGVRGVVAPASKADTDYGLSNPRVEMQTRECIEFGSYWQEDTNGDGVADQNDEKTPIRWQILSEEDTDGDGEVDDLFLLADKCLDCQEYNSDGSGAEWENCSLRKWLNEDFYYNAFNSAEKKMIKNTKIVNDENDPFYETEDNLFLLSYVEVFSSRYRFSPGEYYYCSPSREGKASEYVKNQNVGITSQSGYEGNCCWWLRSPGYSSWHAAYVENDGSVGYYGKEIGFEGIGAVRPAMHLDFSLENNDSIIKDVGEVYLGVKKCSWDCITFGNYIQEDTNGDEVVDENDTKTPIKWRVLSVDGDDAFLISDKCLDNKPYNDGEDFQKIDWIECSLRKWLNEDFYNMAFNVNEKSAINSMEIINNGTRESTTVDYITLLSLSDALKLQYGFSSGTADCTLMRRGEATDYSVFKGAELWGNNVCWWLRSETYCYSSHYLISFF